MAFVAGMFDSSVVVVVVVVVAVIVVAVVVAFDVTVVVAIGIRSCFTIDGFSTMALSNQPCH